MMTSRSEYRLVLRQDNANERLLPVGHKYGLVSDERYERFLKLKETLDAISKYGGEDGFITAENSQSGINLILRVACPVLSETEDEEEVRGLRAQIANALVSSVAELGIRVRNIDQLDQDGCIYLILYYNQIPLDKIEQTVRNMTENFRKAVQTVQNTIRI
jgi:hypothetical protein